MIPPGNKLSTKSGICDIPQKTSAVALVSANAEWSVAVDGTPWENWFEFAWNIQLSLEGVKVLLLPPRMAEVTLRQPMTIHGRPASLQ
jgi:hypothetical protein